jgi:hypothetical protein
MTFQAPVTRAYTPTLQSGVQDYSVQLYKQFEAIAPRYPGKRTNQTPFQGLDRPNVEQKFLVSLFEDMQVFKSRELMEYKGGQFIQVKKGFCGSSKVKHNVLQYFNVEREESEFINDKRYNRLGGYVLRVEVDQHKVLIVHAEQKVTLDNLWEDLNKIDAINIVNSNTVKNSASRLPAIFKIRLGEYLFNHMSRFTLLFGDIEKGLNNAIPVDQTAKETSRVDKQIQPSDLAPQPTATPEQTKRQLARQDSSELFNQAAPAQRIVSLTGPEYSELMIQKNNRRDERLNLEASNPMASVDNYQSRDYRDAQFATFNQTEFDKEDYEDRQREKEKENRDHLIKFVEKGKNTQRSPRATRRTEDGPQLTQMQLISSSGQKPSIKDSIPQKQDDDTIINEYEQTEVRRCTVENIVMKVQRYSSLVLRIYKKMISRKTELNTVLMFDKMPQKFSDKNGIDIYQPQKLTDLFKADGKASVQTTLVLKGICLSGETLEIGRLTILPDELVTLFDALNDEYIALPFTRAGSFEVQAAVVFSCREPEEVERLSGGKDEEPGLYQALQKNPEFDIFHRNNLRKYTAESVHSPSNDERPQSILPNQYPLALSCIPGNDEQELFAHSLNVLSENSKLRMLILDLLNYSTPDEILKLGRRTDRYYNMSTVKRQNYLGTGEVGLKMSMTPTTKSAILNNLIQSQREGDKVEQFDLSLSDDFLTRWATLERLDEYHQILERVLGIAKSPSSSRTRDSQTRKRRVAVMCYLYYFIFQDYFVRSPPSNNLKMSSLKQSTTLLLVNPLITGFFKGLVKDFYLFTVFTIDNCPNILKRMTVDWQAGTVLLTPKILELFSCLFSTQKFALILDYLYEYASKGKSAPLLLSFLCCVLLEHFDQYLIQNSEFTHSNLDFLTCLKKFCFHNEDKVFNSLYSQVKANIEKNEVAQKGMFSGIFQSIHEVVKEESNSVTKAIRVLTDLNENEQIEASLKMNVHSSVAAMKLLELSQSSNWGAEKIISVVKKITPPVEKNIYFKLSSFKSALAGISSKEDGKINIWPEKLAAVEQRFVLKIRLPEDEAQSKLLKLEPGVFDEIYDFHVDGELPLVILLELEEVEPFDLYRNTRPTEVEIMRLNLDYFRSDVVHPISLKVRNKNNFYDEYLIGLQVLIADTETAFYIKEETKLFDDGKSGIDRNSIERQKIYETKETIKEATGGSLIHQSIKRAGFIDFGEFKVSSSSLEAVVNRNSHKVHKDVFQVKSGSLMNFNHFSRLKMYADPSIGYMDIIKNLAMMPDQLTFNWHGEDVSSFTLLLRVLLFNKDIDMLVTSLLVYFGRDGNCLFASDLVFVFSKIFETMHLKAHQIEVADYLKVKLDRDLRPRLKKAFVVLTDEDLLADWQHKPRSDSFANTFPDAEVIDFTDICNELIFWMSFKYDCLKMTYGFEGGLFLIEDLVSRMRKNQPVYTQNNFLSIEIEYNDYRYREIVRFNERFAPLTNKTSRSDLFHSSQRPGLEALFSLDRYSIDLRPLCSVTISRIELDRLFHSSEIVSYLHDVCKF